MENKFWILTLGLLITALFTGCGVKTGEPGITPLHEDELTYFNETFFNQGDIYNMFLNSLYSEPEKIDLFELFYLGNGLEENGVPAEEREAVIAHNKWSDDPDCDCQKNSRSNMNTILMKNMGLTLDDTEKTGLEKMTYLEEYDAYYYFHGDTNYQFYTFFKGEREKDIIRLYYNATIFFDGDFHGGTKVLKLREKDGSYQFVSNQMDVINL